MNAIQTAAGITIIQPTTDITLSMFDAFVSFVDRGERTTSTYITNLRQFAAFLSYRNIKRPLRPDVIAFRDYLTSEHAAIRYDSVKGWDYQTRNGAKVLTVCKPSTVAQYLRAVCQFFRWTAAEGVYPDIAANIHAPKIRHAEHKKDALTAADVLNIEKSIAAAAAVNAEKQAASVKDPAGRQQRAIEQGLRLRAMYTLAVNAGLRTVELERATVKDIYVMNGKPFIMIWGKGHTEPDTRKALAPEVYDTIKAYLDARADRPSPNSPLFIGTGNRSRGRIAARTISQMLKKAMVKAGYDSERITAHSLRHTAGTEVMIITNDLYGTQKYMRHSNPATTEIYLHNDDSERESGIAQRLYDRYHGVINDSPDRESIFSLTAAMSAEQLKQLHKMAMLIKKQ